MKLINKSNLIYFCCYIFQIILSLINAEFTPGPLLVLFDQVNFTGNSVQLMIGEEQTFNGFQWVQIGDNFIQVTYDGHQICGVTTSHTALCADFEASANPRLPLNWRSIPGLFFELRVHGGSLFGLGLDRTIWAGNSSGDTNWRLVESDTRWALLLSGPRDLAYDGTHICAMIDDVVWCAYSKLGVTHHWHPLPNNVQLKKFSLGKEQLYGVSESGTVYYQPSPDSTTPWTLVQGSLNKISFDGQTLCGTESNGKISCAGLDLQSKPNWYQVPDSLFRETFVYGPQTIALGNDNRLYASTFGYNTCINVPTGFDVHSLQAPNGGDCVIASTNPDCPDDNYFVLDPTQFEGRVNLTDPYYPIMSFRSCQQRPGLPTLA